MSGVTDKDDALIALVKDLAAAQKVAQAEQKVAQAKQEAEQKAAFAELKRELTATKAEVVASRLELTALTTEVSKLKAQIATNEGASAATPQEYEDAGRRFISSELERRFGLRAISDASPHRAEGDIRDDAAHDFRSVEWDYRMPVTVSAQPTHPGKAADFIIYFDRDRYICPPRPAVALRLTPTKAPGAEAPPGCDYMAIFEITTVENWTRGQSALLPRLEERLRVSLDRARANSVEVGDDILRVVAVIGVVSPYSCQPSVGFKVTAIAFPLLFRMMSAARFVFLLLTYEPS